VKTRAKNGEPSRLTEDAVRSAAAEPGQRFRWLADGAAERGADRGQLYLRVMAPNARGDTVRTYYYRFATASGRRGMVKIGRAGTRPGEYTLAQARKERDRLRDRRVKEGRDVRAVLDAERAAQQATEEKERQQRAATLQALLDLYVAHLQDRGSDSHQDVANIIKNHVTKAHPRLTKKPAALITPDDILDILDTLIAAGKARTAGKLRSFLAAAFSLAIRAKRTSQRGRSALRGFGVTMNPVAETEAIPIGVRHRVLTADELRLVLAEIDKIEPMNGVPRSALRLCLLLAGPRPEQLLRARVTDVDLAAGTITLQDRKGRRRVARPNVLPLTSESTTIIARLVARSGKLAWRAKASDTTSEKVVGSPWLFTTLGPVPLAPNVLSRAVHAISARLVADGRLTQPFMLADLRRTCETMLAAMGISKDLRAQILSHGIGGVQDTHYDKHGYLAEKRTVLEAWAKRLDAIVKGEPLPSNITQLPRAA
jgi:Phage integrase family